MNLEELRLEKLKDEINSSLLLELDTLEREGIILNLKEKMELRNYIAEILNREN